MITPELFLFLFNAKSWRGSAFRRACHRSLERHAQMWSAVQKVTRSCSLMESQRKKRTRPARMLAEKSLLENKTCRRRCVYDTNYCGESVFLPEKVIGIKSPEWEPNDPIPALCSSVHTFSLELVIEVPNNKIKCKKTRPPLKSYIFR